MRARAAVVLLALAALAATGAARADGPPAEDPFEFRMIPVAAIVRGNAEFVADRGPFPVASDQVNDEANPMFGGEFEGPIRPFGTIEDLIERVKKRTAAGAWEQEGVSIVASGQTHLIVKAPRSLLDAADAFLAGLEADATSIVTIDALALGGSASLAAAEGGLAAAISRGEARVLAGVRTSAHPFQRVGAFSGDESAYVQDYDVEVAKGMATVDPIVGIVRNGLSLDVRPTVVGDRVTLEVQAWLARIESMERRTTTGGDAFEVPVVDGRTCFATLLRVAPGAWTFVPSSGDVSFAFRVTVERGAVRAPTTSLQAMPPTPMGSLSHHVFDARDLAQRVENFRGRELHLVPSNYTPPEPPELMEPTSLFPTDFLVEMVKQVVDPEAWTQDGVSIQTHRDRLHVRIDDAHAAGIEALLSDLKGRFVRGARVDAEVLSLPGSPDFPAKFDRPADVRSCPGATVLARASVRVAGSSQRSASVDGIRHDYVGDYDVEIAEKASIGNPIVDDAYEGVSLDLAAVPRGDVAALSCELRWDRTTWKGQRSWPTRHGAIDLPRLGLERMRGACLLKIGETKIVSATTDGERVVVVLLTASAD